MAKQEKINQKEEIRRQIQKLRDEANTANVKIQKFIKNRNQLNDQVKKAREEIALLKTERDSINENVKLLKQQRDAIREKSDPITDEINTIKDKIDGLKKKLPRESQRQLQEELDAIEWKIQTTSLDLQEEKMLIKNVKQLEIQLSGYKKIDAQRKKIKDLVVQKGTFRAQADTFHKELTDLASKSQEIHSSMIEKLNSLKASRAQADSQHQAYIKTKKELSPLYEKIRNLSEQLQNVKTSIQEETKEEAKMRLNARNASEQAAKEKQQAIKEKLGAEARDKLQKGEKLSWDEFQLVMGDDSQDDSETQD